MIGDKRKLRAFLVSEFPAEEAAIDEYLRLVKAVDTWIPVLNFYRQHFNHPHPNPYPHPRPHIHPPHPHPHPVIPIPIPIPIPIIIHTPIPIPIHTPIPIVPIPVIATADCIVVLYASCYL